MEQPIPINEFRQMVARYWPELAKSWIICRHHDNNQSSCDDSYHSLKLRISLLKGTSVKHPDKSKVLRTLIRHYGFDKAEMFDFDDMPSGCSSLFMEYLAMLDGLVGFICSEDDGDIESYMGRTFPNTRPQPSLDFNVGSMPSAILAYEDIVNRQQWYFTTPCHIRHNNASLLGRLKDIGYTVLFSARNSYGTGLCAHDGIVASSTGMNVRDTIDCGDNEELFLALAALRDGTDYGQWFTDGKEWHLLSFCGECRILDDTWHKATAEELIKRFNGQQCTPVCLSSITPPSAERILCAAIRRKVPRTVPRNPYH